tara:strand:- start:4713 stop:5078 length:366 start_codon:yes stop_codon:yes gene_type:complete
MASLLGRNAFTVQESVNMESFSDWNFESVDVSGDSIDASATYITAANPAKKVVLYDRGGQLDAGDDITVTLNGESGTGKPIIINGNNLPFTISGLLITSLSFTIPDADTDANELLTILSFH